MTNKEAIDFIRTHPEIYLTKDKSKRGYICPICGSGRGKNGTGLTTKDQGQHFTCWAGCFTNADLIDIIGQKNGIPLDNAHFFQRLRAAAQALNITLDGKEDPAGRKAERARASLERKRKAQEGDGKTPPTDYTAFFKECAARITETDYHRGISLDTLRAYGVGYCDKWSHPKDGGRHISKRLIIPTSKNSYLARDTENNGEYAKQKAGPTHIFNLKALETATEPIFIVEGELDALSLIDLGAPAIGLSSVTMINKFLDHVRSHGSAQRLLLALDKDKAGQEAEEKLQAGLDAMGIFSYRLCGALTEPYKDANERLNKDPAGLKKAISEAVKASQTEAEQKAEEERAELERETVLNQIPEFMAGLQERDGDPVYTTGLPYLDEILGGGITTGLYFVGAVSALGKSAFVLQLADEFAIHGADVLIFTLEMSRRELMCRTVSRLSAINENTIDRKPLEGLQYTKTTGELLRAHWEDWAPEEQDLIKKSVEDYSTFADHLTIKEGLADIGTAEIRDAVARFKRIKGHAPIVVIDYCQILAPDNDRETDKQKMDRAAVALKRLSRDFSIPVIAISSFNRENYTAPVNAAAFKESGGLEFTADCLIALQYLGMNYRTITDQKTGEKKPEPDNMRQIRINDLMDAYTWRAQHGESIHIHGKVLKSRNGTKGEWRMEFYSRYNLFVADQPIRADTDAQTAAEAIMEAVEGQYTPETEEEAEAREKAAFAKAHPYIARQREKAQRVKEAFTAAGGDEETGADIQKMAQFLGLDPVELVHWVDELKPTYRMANGLVLMGKPFDPANDTTAAAEYRRKHADQTPPPAPAP